MNGTNFSIQSTEDDTSVYNWFNHWMNKANADKDKCIRCGEAKELTSRLETTNNSSGCINTTLYKNAKNLEANLCMDCYNELEENFNNV